MNLTHQLQRVIRAMKLPMDLRRRLRRPLEQAGLLQRPPGRVPPPHDVPCCRLYRTSTTRPDPSPLLASAHRLGPVLYDVDHECWMVVSHRAVAEALRDESRFSHEYMADFDPFLAGTSGASHRHFRSVLQAAAPWFDQAMIQAFSQRWMEPFCDRVIAAGGFEAVTDLGVPLPRAFTIHLLGLSAAEADRMITALHRRRTEMNAALGPLAEALAVILESRRRRPPDDPAGLLQALIRMGDAGQLSDDQIISLTRHLWFAGTVSLSGLLPACVAHLSRDPQLTATLSGNPALVAPFVSEVLRLESVTQFLYRRCTQDMDWAGVGLRRDDLILLHLGAANRDPAVFPQPDALLLTRQPYQHLAFGLGNHACLGSVIARTIAETCVDTLVRRLPQLRPGRDSQPWRLEDSLQFRELRSWPTTCRP